MRMKESDEPRAFVNKLEEMLHSALPDVEKETRDNLVIEQVPKAVPEKWQLRLLDLDTYSIEVYIRKLERMQSAEKLQKELRGPSTAEAHPVRQTRQGAVGRDARRRPNVT